jgi:phosphate transport system substrate-binding protein
MTAKEQVAATGGPIAQVPVALGGEGIVYNLSLPAGARLHLTGPVLAAIFLGRITSWHDPAITTLNPGLSVPAATIRVIHRSDGSGTTYIFSDFLSAIDPAWAAKVGTGKPLNWPIGEGAPGNAGVAAAVYRTPFFTGYVEQAYSRGLLLPFAAIRNQAGNYITPSAQTVSADAARKTGITPADFSIVNQPGAASYPDQRVQLGTPLRPPAGPGHRPGAGHHARLAHPRRPGLRRRQRLRPTATPRSGSSPVPRFSRSPAPPKHTS